MDTGEAVVDDEDDECDALFSMDDVLDGTADIKKQNTEEVSFACWIVSCPVPDYIHGFSCLLCTYM